MTEPSPRDSKFRLPSKPTKMIITPAIAADWLLYRNSPEKNRRISERIAVRYAKLMQQPGGWRETHQGIAFDTDGWLTDGQTRLLALKLAGSVILESGGTLVPKNGSPVTKDGSPVKFWVHPDEARDVFDVLDTGRRRNAAQLLHKPHPTATAGAVRFLVIADRHYTSNGFREARNLFMDNTEILTFAREYGDDLDWAVHEAVRIYAKTGIPASAHAAMLFQARRSPYRDLLSDWLVGLETGAVGFNRDDPRLRLREAFGSATKRAASSRTRSTPYALIVKAWIRYTQRKSVAQLMWRNDEMMPEVPGFVPTGSEPKAESKNRSSSTDPEVPNFRTPKSADTNE